MKRKKQDNQRALHMVQRFFPLVGMVEDAEHGMIVNVTRADVAKSHLKSHRTCALAVCCKRTFNADGVIIGITTAYIIKGKKATRFTLPNSIGREITSYDRAAGFDEGEYMLVPTSPNRRFGMPRVSGPSGPHGGDKKRGFRHITGRVRTTLQHL